MDSSPSEHDVEQAIVAYIAEHPHAMDTLEGIAEWWLMSRIGHVDPAVLAEVLRRLTERGVLEEVRIGPHSRYRPRWPQGNA